MEVISSREIGRWTGNPLDFYLVMLGFIGNLEYSKLSFLDEELKYLFVYCILVVKSVILDF